MEYVAGGNLATFVRDQPLPARRAAELVKRLAEAVNYAHEHGVLHRDLKPTNIVLDDAGHPRITDFGLARREQTESFLTTTGQVLGSPNFMPPEQAGTDLGKAGSYGDVYALGGILFYVLTGRPPFVAGTIPETLNQVLNSEPVSPRVLNASVPGDLATVCLKCLEKEPMRRYATARELADELNRFLRDEPVRARPIRTLEKAWRWCKRKPALAASLFLLNATVAIGAGGVLWQWYQAEQTLYVANVYRANQALEVYDLTRTKLFLRAIEVSVVQRLARDWPWR
jgi:serine/threonine protein kinase